MRTQANRLPYMIEQITSVQERLMEVRDTIDTILGRLLGPNGTTTAQKTITPTVPLSKQEQRILQLIRTGKKNKEIAEIIGIARRTVEAHRYNMQRKLGLKRGELKKLSCSRSAATAS